MIIDCHGHYTTAPKSLETWRNAQIAGITDPGAKPRVESLVITDDELRESIEANQLKLMKQRGSDLTIFSPRASFMAHHIGDFRGVEHLGRDLQRAVLSRVAAVSRPLHTGRDAAAEPRRRPQDLHPRAGEVRRAIRQRRHQPEPRSVGWALDVAAADRQALVPDLRKDGRVRHPGDDPCQHQLQRVLSHHRRALHQRRHHRGDAADPGRLVQGLSDRSSSSSRTAAAPRRTTGAATAAWRRS